MLSEGVFVKVREDLIGDLEYGGVYFAPDMECYRGRFFTVSDILYDGNVCLAGIRTWIWHKSMLIVQEPPEATDHKAILKVEIFGLGAPGDIIDVKKYNGITYIGKDYMPMYGILSASEAEIIEEEL